MTGDCGGTSRDSSDSEYRLGGVYEGEYVFSGFMSGL